MSRRKQSNPQQFPELEGAASSTPLIVSEQNIRNFDNSDVGQVLTETIPVSNQEININNCESVDDTAQDKQSSHPEIENSKCETTGMEALDGREICRESPMLDRQYLAMERTWKESVASSSNADSNSPASNKEYDFSPAQPSDDIESNEKSCTNKEDKYQEISNQQEHDKEFEEESNRKRLQMQMKGALFTALQNSDMSANGNPDITSYAADVTENTAGNQNIEYQDYEAESPKTSTCAEPSEECEENSSDESTNQVKSHPAEEDEENEEDGKELDEIKDQVRMLQQQQMYQVQMLNYLHFQLTFIASHPQAPRPTGFTPQSIPVVNGMQLANMPQLLAAAMANNNAQSPAKPNVLTPSVAAALSRQLSTNADHQRPLANEHSGKYPEFAKQDDDILKEKVDRESEFTKSKLLPTPCERSHVSQINMSEDSDSSYKTRLEDQARQDPNNHFCRFCHKVFGSDSALQIHLRSHTGERPYKCNICANRFSTKGNLKVHFTRHAERYPDIEMNQNPIPEYLDNVPTSSGIPYGMSIAPDPSDRVENTTNPPPAQISVIAKTSSSMLPAPFQAIDEPRESVDNVVPRVESDRPSMVKHEDMIRKSNDESDFQNTGLRPFTRFPFVPPPAALLHQANVVVGSKSPNTEIAALPSPVSERNVSSENFENAECAVVKPFSETSKLQRLVDQIDHGKLLEKNECHICHRILSCQSALKLHYRTHTGERPYKCDLCSRAFTTRGNLRTHYSSVHRQQLRSSPPNGGQVRGSGLQCTLCGSRFMDQQSMQQHMQMHLYMHSQQQQHVAHLMNGHPNAEMRMLGMPFNLANLRMNPPDGERDEIMENDDVFDESQVNREDSPKSKDNDVNSPLSSVSLKRKSYEQEENSQYQIQKSLELSENRDFVSRNDVVKRSEARHESRDHITSIEYRKDSKEDTLSEKSGPSEKEHIPSHSNERMTSLHHDIIPSSPRRSPLQPTNSLNALAHLASHGAIMQQSGMSISGLPMSPRNDEGRIRKMTTSCELCNKPFTCQSALEIHLRSHTKERPFLCRVCERGFTTRGNLKQHLLTHNIREVDEDMLEPIDYVENENSNSNSPSASPKINSMPQPLLASKRPLESLPSGSPPAKRNYPRHWCHICQKQFSSASSLQIHNRTHTGEKPFACSVCGRAFTTKGNLKVHMGTHVWGAGGSRRGRRISMDNPLISPWMQNTSANNINNPPLRPRLPPPIPAVHDPTALYQQYAALASGLMGAKAANEARFHNSAFPAFNNAASRLMIPPSNVHITSAATVPPLGGPHNVPSDLLKNSENKNMAAAASEWIWKAYQRTQEQVN